MSQELAGMRVDYVGEGLDVDALAGTWHEQLTKWLVEAQEAGTPEVNAMVLATAPMVFATAAMVFATPTAALATPTAALATAPLSSRDY